MEVYLRRLRSLQCRLLSGIVQSFRSTHMKQYCNTKIKHEMGARIRERLPLMRLLHLLLRGWRLNLLRLGADSVGRGSRRPQRSGVPCWSRLVTMGQMRTMVASASVDSSKKLESLVLWTTDIAALLLTSRRHSEQLPLRVPRH